jgi:hypothetical protein
MCSGAPHRNHQLSPNSCEPSCDGLASCVAGAAAASTLCSCWTGASRCSRRSTGQMMRAVRRATARQQSQQRRPAKRGGELPQQVPRRSTRCREHSSACCVWCRTHSSCQPSAPLNCCLPTPRPYVRCCDTLQAVARWRCSSCRGQHCRCRCRRQQQATGAHGTAAAGGCAAGCAAHGQQHAQQQQQQ